MKKITSAMLLAVGLAASVTASAAGTLIQSGQVITSGAAGACTMLSEDVNVNLSKSVQGAYSCNAANNDIRVATCHTAGSNKQTNLDCAVIGFDATGTVPVYNDTSCNATTPTYTISSYRVFEGSSKGGSVAPVSLGQNCDAQGGAVTGVPFL